MKKNYTTILAFILSFTVISVLGYGQNNNPFSVKQKVKNSQSNHVISLKPLIDTRVNDLDNDLRNQNYPSNLSYATKPFIKPGIINKEAFSLLKHDEKGLLIFAESKPGTEKYFDTRSDAGRLETCYAYLSELKNAMQIHDPVNEFIELDGWDDKLGMNHIKMQQYFKGIKVFGGQIILHGQSGAISKFNGTYYPTPELDDVKPAISDKEAIELAVSDLSKTISFKGLNDVEKQLLKYAGPQSELIIYHDSRDIASEQLAYRIVIRPNLIDQWAVFVDAKTGLVIEKYNMTCTDGPATAQAQDLNGATHTIHTYQVGSQYYLIDGSRSMFNAGQSQLPDKPVGAIWTLDANFTTEQNLEAYQIVSANNSWNNPTAVSAHNSAGVTYEYFKNVHGRNSIDGNGGTIISVININDDDGTGKDNAFWNGAAMFYGNGDQLFYPLAGALDVGAHEMSHGVTQHTANLIYKDQSGAINEAMSDIVGCMVDRDDWRLAEDVVLPNSQYFPSGAMRDMSNPHNGATSDLPGYQPQHTNEMYTGDQDNGGVHINSGIINFAYYKIAEAISKEKAEQLYYRALANYMTQSSQFIDCRLAFEQAAKDLHGNGSAEFNAVVSAFYSVGIGDPDGGGEGTDPPGDLPVNPGQDYIVSVDVNPGDQNTLYISNTEATQFVPISQTPVKRKLSITDDGSFGVFISENSEMKSINLTEPYQEQKIYPDNIWDNVAISKDGSKIAAITTEIDSAIWVYDFATTQWAKFHLFNPSFTEGEATHNVLYADAIEWDYSGQYLIYDAYNELTNGQGQNIDYWDMGYLQVWNNATGSWGDGSIFKLFSGLAEGVSIGNPSLAKNSAFILAFDYLDQNSGDISLLATNLETGEIGTVFENSILSFPNYSKNDNKIVFNAMNTDNEEVVGQIGLNSDKITPSGEPSILIGVAKFAVWYATGVRILSDIEDISNKPLHVSVYPNPVSDELNIGFETDKNENYSIEVFDMFGHRVMQEAGNLNQNTHKAKLNTENLNSGTYFIRITAGNQVITRKVVKM